MHRWHEPYDRALALAAARGIAIATPRMGERLDLAAPHAGERWWRDVAAPAQVSKVSRRWSFSRHARHVGR